MAAVVEGKHTISPLTATCIVVANMMGTGIFTSFGFQVAGVPTGFATMAIWIAEAKKRSCFDLLTCGSVRHTGEQAAESGHRP